MKVDFAAEYLTRQIIAYIGNKRRLLPLLHSAVADIYGGVPRGKRFLDLFAGSGIVSRFAKYLGFEVVSNDWEYYSFVLGRGYVETNLGDLSRLFGGRSEYLELLAHLNALPEPAEKERYLSRYYAPSHDEIEEADFRTERLFYTRRNALALDAMRNEIDRLYPPGDASEDNRLRRDHLTALLLYQAATHTNTSGVFKAFHKGFGGHGKDALKRILGPVELSLPPLIDSDLPCRIYREDAAAFVRSGAAAGADIAYLDPPYNQHQYGSNYHLLNSIALWDKIPAPPTLNDKGVLREKAAIRKDWVLTRSDFCYAEKAAAAFETLMRNIDAENILVSYSTDGIIPFPDLRRICESRGGTSIVTNEYTKYRGGKQSNSRLNANIEFVLIVRTAAGSGRRAGRSRGTEIDKILKLREARLLFKRKFRRERLARHFLSGPEGSLETTLSGRTLRIPTRDRFMLDPPEGIDDLGTEALSVLCRKLAASLCLSKEEELEDLVRLAEERTGREAEVYMRMLPGILKKLAHKKNRLLFASWFERIRRLESVLPEAYELIREDLTALDSLARKRFDN